MTGGMPELLAKDPAAVLELLRIQGAQCGVGIHPEVLTSCPQDRFCMLQEGELCVYGAHELGLMTELAREDVCGPIPAREAASGLAPPALGLGVVAVAVLGFAFVRLRTRRARA